MKAHLNCTGGVCAELVYVAFFFKRRPQDSEKIFDSLDFDLLAGRHVGGGISNHDLDSIRFQRPPFA
jgi:hypothetical protein